MAGRVVGRAVLVSTRVATRPLSARITSPLTVVSRRQYHEKVLDHYSRPRNVGSMSKTDTDVGTGLVGAPACGDVMKFQQHHLRRQIQNFRLWLSDCLFILPD
jgi:hypothetical protein